jgi:UDP-GlcNAc:undecaprenyl-phosphate/decaprenyl-phosphate GlcNAc-1-phosphate transferase
LLEGALLHLSGNSPLIWLAPLCLGLVASLVLTPVARRVAFMTGTLDLPVGMKIHSTATPLLGGVAVYLGFSIATVVTLPVAGPVIGVLLGGLAAVVIGVLDERLTLPPLVHLAAQVVAALVAIIAGLGIIRSVSSPFGGLTAAGIQLPAAIGLVVTLVWLVGMMNTVNFLDGLDGLATGVVAIAAILLAIWASQPQRFFLTGSHREELVLPIALTGALLGFLPYNWHRARIFLGDSGSMFLGLALGALSIIGPAKLATALLVLIIPVLDVAWAIVRRRLRGRSFLSGDKQHVYHRMLELGLTHTQVVSAFYLLCGVLSVLDLALFKMEKLIAFVAVTTLVGVAFVLLETTASRRRPDAASADTTRDRPPGLRLVDRIRDPEDEPDTA